MSAPTATKEYAFSGSLCRIRAFQTLDQSFYCLTIFNLDDYKHLHVPHDEYRCLLNKLFAILSTQATLPTASNPNVNALSIKQRPFDGDVKIKLGDNYLNIGRMTAFGLAHTSPFADVDIFPVKQKKNSLACDPEWDVCTCTMCPVFKRLIDFEATALMRFPPHRRPENVILFHH